MNPALADTIYHQAAQPHTNHYSDWWPDYLFHFTDITNAISIIESGNLLSRTEAVRTNAMKHDNASRDVIRRTNRAYQNYVRFYIRPKTRMQYRVEGVRSEGGAHVPIPVFFLFRPGEILSQPGVLFSDDNVAEDSTNIYCQLTDLDKIPFRLVYPRKIAYKDPEVLLPSPLRLPCLEVVEIYLRSDAEKQTLTSQLNPQTVSKWDIRTDSEWDDTLYYHKETYIKNVTVDGSNYLFEINEAPLMSKFRVTVGYEIPDGTVFYETIPNHWGDFNVPRKHGRLPKNKIWVHFDEHLVYYDSNAMAIG